ncbi:PsbP domain-containing protein 6 [Pseudoscourfieldia marina]
MALIHTTPRCFPTRVSKPVCLSRARAPIGLHAAPAAPAAASSSSSSSSSFSASAAAADADVSSQAPHHHSREQQNAARRRRAVTLGLLATPVAMNANTLAALADNSGNAEGAQVGSYLPASTIEEGFVDFVPDADLTPALRAGKIDAQNPYRFSLPSTWRKNRVANILSGNYCQPSCDEPTTEVLFTDSKEGRAVVIIAPVDKLGRRGKVTDVASVGTLDSIISAVGSYITGDTIEPDENVVKKEEKTIDGKLYYTYELDTPFAINGTHGLASVTLQGEVLVLFAISASDSQWDKAEGKLKTMVDSFRA